MRWLNYGIVLTKWIIKVTYTILDEARYKKLKWRKQRDKRLKGSGGLILVDHTCNMRYIPEGSILRTTASPRQNMWEINLPEDFNKSVKKVAKTLDAIAYM
jgi:hypothetical protein